MERGFLLRGGGVAGGGRLLMDATRWTSVLKSLPLTTPLNAHEREKIHLNGCHGATRFISRTVRPFCRPEEDPETGGGCMGNFPPPIKNQ